MQADYVVVQIWISAPGPISFYFQQGLSTVLPKAALLSCARFTCDIYAKYFLLLLNNIEVQK